MLMLCTRAFKPADHPMPSAEWPMNNGENDEAVPTGKISSHCLSRVDETIRCETNRYSRTERNIYATRNKIVIPVETSLVYMYALAGRLTLLKA